MESFRTIVTVPTPALQRQPADTFLMIGSCFAERIGERLLNSRLNTVVNPNGILYNPHSMSMSLHRLLRNEAYTADDLLRFGDVWHSMAHHGCFSNRDKGDCLAGINQSFAVGRSCLDTSDVVALTFGTAFGYSTFEADAPVANCHRLPATSFTRRLMPASELLDLYRPLIAELIGHRPDLVVILTVSPVRHLRDDACSNQVSKAQLITLAHTLATEFDAVHYFPAYEIMMDDLRDYRFYEADMVHPNAVAVAYIWERFRDWSFADSAQPYFNAIENINARLRHRPRDPDSDSHREFVTNTVAAARELQQAYPHVEFSDLGESQSC
jgi:hypothetical protein